MDVTDYIFQLSIGPLQTLGPTLNPPVIFHYNIACNFHINVRYNLL